MRRLARLLMLLYLLALAAIALWLRPGQPALQQQITGVRLGSYDAPEGVAYLSGHRLDCAGTVPDRCTIDLFGQTLALVGERNPPDHPMQLDGQCSASYAGQEQPCEMTSRHVSVHWFAAIPSGLGFSAEQMAMLRQQYRVENLAERTIMNGVLIATVIGALLGALLLATWPRRSSFRGSRLALGALGFLVVGYLFFVVSLFGTGGLWD